MSQQNRQRQKKLEQKRKKRQLIQKQVRAARSGVGEGPGWRRAASTAPFGPAWISEDFDAEDDAPSLVTVILTRKVKGQHLVELVLVDRTCLGIKNAMVHPPMSRVELEEYVGELSEQNPMKPCEPLVAQSVVFHALDYARSLGFSPHRDFEPVLFGPRPEHLEETPWCREERPLFIAGPYDDVPRIRAQLTQAVGEDNYAFIVDDV